VWKFLNSDTSSHSFWFAYRKMNTTNKVSEKARPETRYFACEWELRKDHCDIVVSFRFPSERWNEMYQSAQERTWNFEFPTCEGASHLQTSRFSSTIWNVPTSSLLSEPHTQKHSKFPFTFTEFCSLTCWKDININSVNMINKFSEGAEFIVNLCIIN
jgi:hypothetical protein